MNKEQFDRIESYLQNTLSEADKRSFEAELETDVNLRSEFEIHQKLNLGLRAMAIEKQILEARQRANQRIKVPRIMLRNNVFQIWSVAASIVLVLGLGWWVWQSRVMSDTSELSSLAEHEMTDSQYKSLPLDSLQKLTKTADAQQGREKAEWYVALAYLKKGRKKEAEEILTRISKNPQHTYSQKAQKLLEQGFK